MWYLAPVPQRRLPRPRSKQPLVAEYRRDLQRQIIVPAADAILEMVVPELEAVLFREDAVGKDPIKRLVNKARRAGSAKEPIARAVAGKAMAATQASQATQWAAQVAAGLGINGGAVPAVLALQKVDPIGAEPWLADKMREAVARNVALIKDLPQDLYDRLEVDLYQWGNQGLTVKEVQARLEAGYARGGDSPLGIVGRRAELIAQDQIGKFHASLDEIRQDELGIDSYEWSTVGDERVRPLCRSLNGKIFKWSKPPEGGHPGQKPRCRCVPIPVFPEPA